MVHARGRQGAARRARAALLGFVGATALVLGGCSRKGAEEPIARGEPLEARVRQIVDDRARADRASSAARAYEDRLDGAIGRMRATRCDLLATLTRYDADEHDHWLAIDAVRRERAAQTAALAEAVALLRAELTEDEWNRLVRR